jgi:hypothetical protein
VEKRKIGNEKGDKESGKIKDIKEIGRKGSEKKKR